LLVRGPANWPKDGIAPLEGVVETDWSEAPFTMNWKMTRPVHRVIFEEGEPIALLVPQRRGELEKFQPELRAIEDVPELHQGYQQWLQSRKSFIAGLCRPGSEEVKQGWQKHYFQGVHLNRTAAPKHQTKLKLKDFVDRRSETDSPDGPYLKRRFLSPAECTTVVEVIRRYARGEPGLKAAVHNHFRIEIPARYVYAQGLKEAALLLSQIRDRCHREIMAAFSLQDLVYPAYMMLKSNYPGDAHVRHADSKRYDPSALAWVANHTPYCVISACMYLNSCGHDFTGGELVFPKHGLTIPPEPGLLVAFPSDEHFEHEVWPIASGQRYSILLWFTHDPALAEPELVPAEVSA